MTPQVRLGAHTPGGLAPAIMAIVERGVGKRPELARALRGEIELALQESAAPVRILFDNGTVLVEDGEGSAPDVRIRGALSDLVSLMAAGRLSALAIVAQRRIKVRGRVGVARRLLAIIRI